MTYYNTTAERGPALQQFKVKAESQEVRLLEFFEANPRELFTREQLHLKVLQDAPVSSIVRALSNLKSDGKIQRTNEKRQGKYGRPMYCWRLAPNPNQLELL